MVNVFVIRIVNSKQHYNMFYMNPLIYTIMHESM